MDPNSEPTTAASLNQYNFEYVCVSKMVNNENN